MSDGAAPFSGRARHAQQQRNPAANADEIAGVLLSARRTGRVIHHAAGTPSFLHRAAPRPGVNCELVAAAPAATLSAVPMSGPRGANNPMSRKPTPTKDPIDSPLKERRTGLQGQGATNPLKRLKGVLGRPVRLEWRNGQPHLALVERRSGARQGRSQAHLCAELRARLLALAADETSKLLRYLVVVHDTLAKKGWEGVGALPATVLARAIRQADMLASEDPSPTLTDFVERLRQQHAAAFARDQALQTIEKPVDDEDDVNTPHRVEVSEASYKEFEDLERSWTRTMPSELAPLSVEG
jgi:hypothetical protein